MMRQLNLPVLFLCFMALLFSRPVSAEGSSSDKCHFTVHRKDYPLASFFEIDADDTYAGVVKKSVFRLRTNYDLSDRHGWQATGVKRVASLGTFFSWATEIDLYDTRWEWIGMIDGQVMSTASARFSIYNRDSALVGIAYLDQSKKGYTITYPESEAYPIARATRQQHVDGSDQWVVTVYDTEQIDDRILRIFVAMACDIQSNVAQSTEK